MRIQLSDQSRVLIWGAGYVAKHLTTLLAAQNIPVVLTSRDEANFTAIRHLGAEPLQFGAPLPQDITHALATVPPLESVDPVLLTYGNDLMGDWGENLTWLGYLSTTGVYGDAGGAEITEEAPLNARTPRAQARIMAEQAWAGTAAHPHIFRLSGIYGPNRDALARIQAGLKEIPAQGGGPVNRIHIVDICHLLALSMQSPSPGEVFNLADDLPAPTREVLLYAGELLGRKQELLSLPQASVPAAGAMGEGHRIVNAEKICTGLGYSLVHPDYKSGLAADLQLLKARHA